ncbi:hypothetical protein THAOC_32673 [Thalassiosira oceanica]|uniref:Uncharacterized protein n=1 Tax=Thalassiosira oceanica TaxID=159749 RepID=K0RHU6_THAOC|nr:hypothetical protein THAOC_32673 [Thalassiosira oceanica]|eukprot:EJK48511.1 hypothetical protein THAOC_32673 [Thalassiosira oceanica]
MVSAAWRIRADPGSNPGADLTGSAPICPDSEPTGSSLQDHDGWRRASELPHGPRARNHRRNIRRRAKRKAARLSRQQVGTSGEDNAQNLARSESKPQDSHRPKARNHRRNILRRRNKRKAARMGSQAQKKTHAMSSGRANNQVQLFTKKASKSPGMGI